MVVQSTQNKSRAAACRVLHLHIVGLQHDRSELECASDKEASEEANALLCRHDDDRQSGYRDRQQTIGPS